MIDNARRLLVVNDLPVTVSVSAPAQRAIERVISEAGLSEQLNAALAPFDLSVMDIPVPEYRRFVYTNWTPPPYLIPAPSYCGLGPCCLHDGHDGGCKQ